MKSHQKAICLVAACSKEGRDASADYALFNYYLKEHTGKNITLDFGNSSINEIEILAKDFHAQNVAFYKVNRSRLLRYFKLF
jgi:hypothetical protein